MNLAIDLLRNFQSLRSFHLTLFRQKADRTSFHNAIDLRRKRMRIRERCRRFANAVEDSKRFEELSHHFNINPIQSTSSKSGVDRIRLLPSYEVCFSFKYRRKLK